MPCLKALRGRAASYACSPLKPTVTSARAIRGIPQLPTRPKRSVTTLVSNSFGTSVDVVNAVSQILTTISIAAGAWLVLNQAPMPEQDRYEQPMEPCPRCGGSGYEACLCNRWSDGDAGCMTCSRTGYMRCRSCGGGGMAVPLLVKVKKSDLN